MFLRHSLSQKLETLTTLRKVGAARRIQSQFWKRIVAKAGAKLVLWAHRVIFRQRIFYMKKLAAKLGAISRRAKQQEQYSAIKHVCLRLQSLARMKIAQRTVATLRDPWGAMTYEEVVGKKDAAEKELEAAIASKDFASAGAIEAKLSLLKEAVEAKRPMTRGVLESMIKEVQAELTDAVANKRFAECAEKQTKLDGLVARRDDFPSRDELQKQVQAREDKVSACTAAKDYGGAAEAQKDADLWAAKLVKFDREEVSPRQTRV